LSSSSLTPEQRSLRARLAAHSLHAQVVDPAAHTLPARTAFDGRFERQVDPDGLLTPAERARRAEHARRAYFLGLAIKSAEVRRRRKQARGVSPPGDGGGRTRRRPARQMISRRHSAGSVPQCHTQVRQEPDDALFGASRSPYGGAAGQESIGLRSTHCRGEARSYWVAAP